MQALPAGGAMVALQASPEQAAALLADYGQAVSIAAVNGPQAPGIAGDEDAVTKIAAEWAQQGGRTRRLRVSHAFHSPRMDPMLGDFPRAPPRLAFSPPVPRIVSH